MTINWNTTAAIALWGAFTGTVAILWDFIKWWADRPRLRVTANPNMQILNPNTRRLEAEQFIQVRVVNTGRRATKITNFVGYAFKTRIHRLLGKPSGGFVVMEPPFSMALPTVLEPGDDWSGLMSRNKALAIAGKSVLYCGVEHTLARKPVVVRIDPRTLRAPQCCDNDTAATHRIGREPEDRGESDGRIDESG